MVKHGPCYHCGITKTPLWRNGPPHKPVLCNACGSRWRTKGTLTNYTPIHGRLPIYTEHRKSSRDDNSSSDDDTEDYESSPEDKLAAKIMPQSSRTISQNEEDIVVGEILPGYEDYTSNRSSTGSTISFSESCIYSGRMDGNDISGSVQSNIWDSHIPSRKRTSIKPRITSPVEKLRRDLCDILQQQGSSLPSKSLEDFLLFKKEDTVDSGEIGLGSILIKKPLSSTEEELESSSVVTENKIRGIENTYMGSSLCPSLSKSCEINSSRVCKNREIRDIGDGEVLKEHPAKRPALANKFSENSLLSTLDVIQSQHSPQRSADLKPLKDRDFKLNNEMSSCSSRVIGGGSPLPTVRPLDQIYLQTSGGAKRSLEAQNYVKTNHRPIHCQQVSSGATKASRDGAVSIEHKNRMVIRVPNPNSRSLSASSKGINSTVLDSKKEIQVHPLYQDTLMRAAFEVPSPPK